MHPHLTRLVKTERVWLEEVACEYRSVSILENPELSIGARRVAGELNRGPVRVFVAGTFDGLHLGHLFLFDFARRRGLALARRSHRVGVHVSVVVARDESVERLKRRSPLHTHRERQRLVAALRSVDEAFVGVPNDFLRSVRRVRPDLIVLGHDQSAAWEERLRDAGFHVPILRCPPYRRAQLKSSALRRDFEKTAT